MAIPHKPGSGEAEPLGNDVNFPEMPTVPTEVQDRFPAMRDYQTAMSAWYRDLQQRLRELRK